TGNLVAANFRPLRVSAPLFPNIALYPVGIGLGSGVLLFLCSVWRLKKAGHSLVARMGSPSWDFSKSWASNVTIGGAILSVALSLTALPEQTRYINRGGYAVLNLLFALLVG